MPDDSRPRRRQFTDAELLTLDFWIREPEALSNLAKDIRANGDEFIPFARYNVRPPKAQKRPRVHCAICLAPRHWRGVALRSASGEHATVGHRCAAKHIGGTYVAGERELQGQEARQYYLRRRVDLGKGALDEAVAAIVRFRSSESLARAEVARKDLYARLPYLFAAVAAAIRNDRTMTRTERYRDLAAEETRRSPGSDIYRTREVNLGTIQGAEFIVRPGESPSVRMGVIADRWSDLLHQLKMQTPTDDVSTRELRRVLDDVADDLREVDEAHRVARSAIEFFDLGNIAAIVRWINASELDGGPYEVANGQLRSSAAAIQIPVLSMPGLLQAPELRLIVGGRGTGKE